MKPESLSLQGALHEIEHATRFAGEFCSARSLDPADARVLVLILEELITNTIKHGSPPPGAAIDVVLELVPEGIAITYRDRGKPFDPHHDLVEPDLNSTLTRRLTGGLGWPLIKFYCSRVDYRRDGETNLLQLTMRLAEKDAPPP